MFEVSFQFFLDVFEKRIVGLIHLLSMLLRSWDRFVLISLLSARYVNLARDRGAGEVVVPSDVATGAGILNIHVDHKGSLIAKDLELVTLVLGSKSMPLSAL